MDRDDLSLFERSLQAATETTTGADLDAALAQLGWADALRVEPRASVALLFDLQGRSGAISSSLDVVLRDALGLDVEAPLVWPALGGCDAPGDGSRLRGVGGAAAHDATQLVVVHADGRAVLVPAAGLTRRTVAGVDPAAGLVVIEGPGAGEDLGPVDWGVGVQRAQRAVAHELVGASRKMLELARTHALERVQFGVPIASFQAVRHRLAETLVAIETADAALDAAWIDDAPHHTAIAKALAGRGARTAAKHCQQVLAGIGFTMEHPFHRYLRRVLVLDELFGSARVLTRQLGEEILATEELPPLLAL